MEKALEGDNGREGTNALRILEVPDFGMPKYKEAQGRCELSGCLWGEGGVRQALADPVEEVTSRRQIQPQGGEAQASTEGVSGLRGPEATVPVLPPAASRAKSGLLRLAAEGGGEGRRGGLWSHMGLGSDLGTTTY